MTNSSITVSDFVRKCIFNCRRMLPDYYKACLTQRLADGKGSVTEFTDFSDLENALLDANWKIYTHPNIAPDCTAYITKDICGFLGMIKLEDLPSNQICEFIDPKGTGTLSLATKTGRAHFVDFTVLIVGKENDVDVMYTFHPGEPLKPSTLAADGSNEFGFKVGDKITVEDAIAAGFKTVKAEE